MIKIENKQDCCGCAACVQRCPKHCISLKEDEEGFLYPFVDESICIDCGLCEKVCPWLNNPTKLPSSNVFAVKNRNDDERMASSSGGVFIALAKETIENGGVVFGAVFDDNWEVRHTYAESLEGVKAMMGSKYLQSRIGDSYRDAERFLKQGRKVLFTGSPCQITALHTYLRNYYPNLVTVDVLCHGVPSPGVWRKYIDEEFNISKNSKKIRTVATPQNGRVITGIEFRDKTLNGWKNYCFAILGKSTPEDYQNSVFHRETHNDNHFMKGFLANIYLRPSCYRCKCKNGVSHSDLTIADFWGINVLLPDFDDDKGVSLVLVNTTQGNDMLRQLGLDVRELPPSIIADAAKFNGGFKEYIKLPSQRKLFYESLSHGNSVKASVAHALHVPFYKRVLRKTKYKIKKILM